MVFTSFSDWSRRLVSLCLFCFIMCFLNYVINGLFWSFAVLLNSPTIFDRIFSDEYILDIIGALECKYMSSLVTSYLSLFCIYPIYDILVIVHFLLIQFILLVRSVFSFMQPVFPNLLMIFSFQWFVFVLMLDVNYVILSRFLYVAPLLLCVFICICLCISLCFITLQMAYCVLLSLGCWYYSLDI